MDMPKITIDTSKIKNALSRLTFIRNYSAYILPLVLIAVAGILFIVSRVMSSGLKSRIQKESIQLGRSVQTFIPQDISSRQWQVEKRYQDSLEADANGISNLMKQMTQRELLSYGLFPEPKDTSALIFEQYGQKYRQGIENLITLYGARGCPTPMEIAKALQQSRPGGPEPMDSFSDAVGDAGAGYSAKDMDKAERMIVNELCREAARKANFYVEPLDIAGYEYWGKKPSGDVSGGEVYRYRSIGQSVQVCWYWQLGYWIIEDVFKTIGAMNSQCNNVMDCPVKRLMQVSFVSGSKSFALQTEDVTGAPRYIRQSDEEETAVHTGRISNDEIDVVHFKISVIIDPQVVLGFMDELCSAKEHMFKGWSGDQSPQKFLHNQITVLEVNINPVNINADRMSDSSGSHQWYYYGDDAVVEMELLCEYIFERAGYDEIKPEIIKNQASQEN
jgi:hypothetical protein